jgi:hypothetical protein
VETPKIFSCDIYIKKSYESSINDIVQSSYSQCTLKETKQLIPNQQFFVEPDAQWNKRKHNVNIKENEKKSICIDIYNKQIQDVIVIPCFDCERLFFKNNLNVLKTNYQNNFLHIFKFK